MAGNISIFDAPAQDLRPTETGIESVAGAARRGGAFFNQAAEAKRQTGAEFGADIRDAGAVVDRAMTHYEISAGAATEAQMLDGLTKSWNDTIKNADPNDPSVAAKFREEVLEPTLEKFNGSFGTQGGQDFALRRVDQIREHMFQKTAADMATKAGEAVKVNLDKTVNSLSSLVANDPSSLDFALKTAEEGLSAKIGSSPTITPDVASRLTGEVLQKSKEQIVKAAVFSMVQKNPSINLEEVQKKYGDYINGAEMKQFQKAAQAQAKADMLQNKQLETYQRQQQERAATDSLSKVITDNMSFDPQTGQVTIKPQAIQQTLDIAKKYPEAGPAQARAMIDWIEAQQNKGMKAVDDPTVVKDFSDRLFSAEQPLTTQQLMKARVDGKISDHTFMTMNGLVKELASTPLSGPVYEETMKAVHDQLVLNVPGIRGKDAVGTTKYSQFVQNFIPKYLAMSRAGTLPPNALDVNDPTSLISQTMAPFKRTMQQRLADFSAGAGGLSPIGTSPPAAAAPSVPPPDKRTVGEVYDTPKGKMKWTADGWVKP